MIDTQDQRLLPDLPPPGGGVRPPAKGHRLWALPLLGLAVLALAVIIVTSLLPASLVARKRVGDALEVAPYALTPRTATPVDDRVSFGQLAGVAEVDTDRTGDIFFVTVSEPSQSVLGWWVAGGSSCEVNGECSALPQIDVLTREDKFGSQTPNERRGISLQMMRTASQVAQYVALRKLGYTDATIEPGAVVVGRLVCLVEAKDGTCAEEAPAAKVLQVGDTITAVDGRAVGTVDDLSALLADKQPGDTVTLDIERQGSGASTVQVTLSKSPQEDRTIIGIVPFDTATVHLPFEVDIDTGQIGGPSAGLAFTLTLIDELSAGDLTGGTDVAVTGEIHLDGSVGAIGGLAQKVSAVRQAGVRHFLVPTAQGPEQIERARQIGGEDVEIIPVATLDEALAALERLGGDPLPAPAH